MYRCFIIMILLVVVVLQTHAFSLTSRPTMFHQTTSTTLTTRQWETPSDTTDMVQVTDVEQAVEALQEADLFEPPVVEDNDDTTTPLNDNDDDEDEVQITIENEMTDVPDDFDKETVAAEIEQVLLDIAEDDGQVVEETVASSNAPPLVGEETQPMIPPPETITPGLGFAKDIQGRFQRTKNEPHHHTTTTVEEAAVSASLYMNPVTEKISSQLVISWEPAVAELLLHMTRVSNPNRPLLVGLVGIPGSGKSTSAEILAALLSTTTEGGSTSNQKKEAIIMPMDGFHLPLETLGQMPNAPDLIYRRGAPDTFDPQGLAMALERIRSGTEDTVTIPGFDHAKGDPVPNQHVFDRSRHHVVICEGIYLLYNQHGWEHIQNFFDWTIYIDANVDACIERLKERNMCIPGYTPEEIQTRCDIVDRNNAELSRDSAYKFASQIVQSGAS